MPRRIEDHALLGDGETVALVDRAGAVDWLCWPRVDSEALFCALLGDDENGFWRIAPLAPGLQASRRYRDGTLVLETRFEGPDGCVEVVDALPVGTQQRHLVRIVRGLRGRMRLRSEVAIRFGYGLTVPWVTHEDGVLTAVGGAHRLVLRSTVAHVGREFRSCADFEVQAGEEVPFVLSHGVSFEPAPPPLDAHRALDATTAHWRAWLGRCRVDGPLAPVVQRSLLTLKALTNARTGGIVAAATTSLPEEPGGNRNWDYRYCWLRDSTMTLLALLQTGYVEEAREWRNWLLRAAAGAPHDMQIMYGVAGERLLPEWEADWLPGFGGARPVRIGNAAARQRQLDIYGEVADVMLHSAAQGLLPDLEGLHRGLAVMRHVARIWQEPDRGMWEVRGEPRQFTHSKVMAWVAIDRFVRLAEMLQATVDLAPWRALRDEIHAWVCRHCVHPEAGHFVQYAGARSLDAALLMLPLVGFLPPGDPRMVATVDAIERDLVRDGLVCRYITDPRVDGLPPGEGAFVACSFWLVDNLVLQGRLAQARALYERLLALCNDVGLLSEEYDPVGRRMLGNFPQAFSHIGIVNSALNLMKAAGPAKQRAEKGAE
ncbi:MAG TPA: glycoside hydrolase family 15 protein [Ramlibacter sp.]|jgi:GH15 family glucan-1,4-alpha-glucosidase|uniref:glycoside hydrolase family 15 protein n=1 Tax=Ramlibacter sp. TaxID=1917967 RepID=UPI002D2EDE8F|nr:glycoside hydrolase family 15 protein [Ramlibacter sp.]HZY19639.1 glycoside hydrolase family 15 protein [Ramlibacter sp.]